MTFVPCQMGDPLTEYPDLVGIVHDHNGYESGHEQGQNRQIIGRIGSSADGPGLGNDVGEIGRPHPTPHEDHNGATPE